METRALNYIKALNAFKLVDNVDLKDDDKAILKLKKAYVKFNSIEELVDICKEIHEDLPNKSDELIRQWVELIKNIHPNVWSQLKDLDYFKPVSEEVGGRTLGYYADTSSLELKDWGDATAIRKTIEGKIDSNVVDMVKSSYKLLTQWQADAMPSHYFNATDGVFEAYTSTQKRLTYGKTLVPHDFYFVGDFTYKTIIETILPVIELGIKSTLKGAEKLINHMTPLNISVTVNNVGFEITPEQKTMTVNLRKERVEEPITEINNGVLIP